MAALNSLLSHGDMESKADTILPQATWKTRLDGLGMVMVSLA